MAPPDPAQPAVSRRPADLRGRPRLAVSGDALRHNLAALRAAAGPGVKVAAVVKADGYGHGAAGVADALFDPASSVAPPDFLAVATLAEALELPCHDVPVMAMRPAECCYLGDNRREIEQAVRRGVWLSVVSVEAAGDVARVAERLGVRAGVQVMLDTGMNREMCCPRRFGGVVDAVLRRPALRLAGVGTHFTDGELGDDEPYNDEQLRLFHDALDPLIDRLPASVVRHAANTGGTLTGEPCGEMTAVRCGLGVYGIDPSCRPVRGVLRPAARLTAPLLLIRDVPAGAAAGYGRTWYAKRPTRVGLVPIGYADGYPRGLSNVPALVEVGGAMCDVAGRVSMDYVTVDLTPAPAARPGDEVTLVSDDPTAPHGVASLAARLGTIPYELLCNIGRRVARQYV